MKDFLSWLMLSFIKLLNLEISLCHLEDFVKDLHLSACRTYSATTFKHSINRLSFGVVVTVVAVFAVIPLY